MSRASKPVPPPLPGDRVIATYPTRNDAFSVAFELRLEGDGERLRVCFADGVEHVVAIADLVEVRLEFAPTRMELNRYRCRMLNRKGRRWAFFNRRYAGIASFEPTDAAYIEFVRALLLAVARHAPQCRCVAGAGGGSYALGIAGFVIAAAAVLTIGIFALKVGLWWLIIVKVLLILFYFPVAWQWLKRNRERMFKASAIPEAVLP